MSTSGINKTNSASLSNFKVGTKKSQLKTKTQQSLFDSLDKNKDGNLSSSELNSGIVKGKVKNAKGQLITKDYVKLKSLPNGRTLVADQNGKQWVMAHDGVILKEEYVKNNFKPTAKTTNTTPQNRTKTTNFLAKEFNSAQKAFNAQMEKDGWAGDLADGISRAWTWATDSKNSANYVREDLKNQKKNVQDLQKAAKQGDAQFKAKFKEIYGINYNQAAMDAYMANPSEANYKKAFGSKVKNIKTRVDKYNQSQDTGAVAVKTTAKVAAGVAVGVATGGVGAAALGATALGTAAASVAIEETDALKVTDAVTKGKFEFREGTDHKKILTDAAWDGASVLAGGAVGKVAGTVISGTSKAAIVGRAAFDVAGDTAMGAAREYAETGTVTVSGTVQNAVTSAIGSAVTSGTLYAGKKIINKFMGKSGRFKVEVPNQLYDSDGNSVSGGLFNKSKKAVDLSPNSGWQNFKVDGGEVTIVNSDGKIWFGEVGPAARTKQININPGESQILGQVSDGTNLILSRSTDGSYSVVHQGTESSRSTSLLDRLFGSKKSSASSGEVSTSPQRSSTGISDKQLRNRVNQNLHTADGSSSAPGRAKLAQKLTEGLESPVVRTLDDNVDLSNISSHVRAGDVVAVKTPTGKPKLYVNNNGTAQEIRISKEKFEELFPKGGFGMVQQQGHNNCWLVSRLNSMTESASGRAQLYSMLEETADGSILVHLKNSSEPIRFPGGRPVDITNLKLGEGASPGVEMIQQAVLAKQLKSADGPVSDITQLSLNNLSREADALTHSDFHATRFLTGRMGKQIQPGTSNYESQLLDMLESLRKGQDMSTATWSMHARSIVDYNPATKMVTYHDPYYGGVDLEIPFDEFKKLQPYVNVVKAPPSATISTQGVNTPPESVPIQHHTVSTEAPRTTVSQEVKPKTSTLKPPPGFYPSARKINGMRTIVNPQTNVRMVEINGKWQRVI